MYGTGLPNSDQQRVVLAEVAHQPDAVNPTVVGCGRIRDHRPTRVGAAVVDQDDLVGRSERSSAAVRRGMSSGRNRSDRCTGNDGRDPGGKGHGPIHARNVAPPVPVRSRGRGGEEAYPTATIVASASLYTTRPSWSTAGSTPP